MSAPDHHDYPCGGFELVRRSVPADLGGLVLRMTGYRERGDRPIRQVETAALVAPLIIGFGAPFEIALGREPTSADRYGSFAAGLYAGPVLMRSHGASHCIQVDFTPLGAYRFFGLPMRELADRMVALDDLGDPALRALRERLGEERAWGARFALAEAFVRGRLARGRPGSPATERAYRRILATGGRIPVARLAKELDWSRKHLAARFREEVGLPPKLVARIARFQRAHALAAAGGENGWADVAAACGYADQAHLAREFRQLAGATPTAWLADAPR